MEIIIATVGEENDRSKRIREGLVLLVAEHTAKLKADEDAYLAEQAKDRECPRG